MTEVLTDIKPKLGFLGVGWIGRSRLEAIASHNIAEIRVVSDPNQDLSGEAMKLAPDAKYAETSEELLSAEVDGVLIATPSALHAEQSLAAIEKGKAVFCQKPLGRNAAEVREVVEAAQKRNVLLGVDFSYRFTNGVRALKSVLDSGELGEIFGARLLFHNAYGPDKSWYFDPQLAGGGCVTDLGIHLIDLLVWLFDDPKITEMKSQLYSRGKVLHDLREQVEDYAVAQFMVNDRMTVEMACSWNLPAGRDAVIEVSFYGTNGGVSFKNLNGSFYDFITERYSGTTTTLISEPGDSWGGKAALAWTEELAQAGNNFNPEALQYIKSAEIMDMIYKRQLI